MHDRNVNHWLKFSTNLRLHNIKYFSKTLSPTCKHDQATKVMLNYRWRTTCCRRRTRPDRSVTNRFCHPRWYPQYRWCSYYHISLETNRRSKTWCEVIWRTHSSSWCCWFERGGIYVLSGGFWRPRTTGLRHGQSDC